MDYYKIVYHLKIKMSNIILPERNEYVRVEYLEIDEIEILCWLCDYGILGYMENEFQYIRPHEKGKKSYAYVQYIFEDGKILLRQKLE